MKSTPRSPAASAPAGVSAFEHLARTDRTQSALDEAVRLASILCAAPMAAIVLAERGHSFFASSTGFIPSSLSLQAGRPPFAVPMENDFVVTDLSQPPVRFSTKGDQAKTNGEPDLSGFRFFAGVPILDASGRAFGLLCVLDGKRRQLPLVHIDGLKLLARQIVRHLDAPTAEPETGADHEEAAAHPAAAQSAAAQPAGDTGSADDPDNLAVSANDPLWSEQGGLDELTGLPNRVLAFDRLAVSLSVAERTGTIAAAMFVGLDGFTDMCEHLSRVERDQVIQLVARRLVQTVRQSDTVARFAGEEFLVLLPDLRSVEDIEIVADKIRDAITLDASELPCEGGLTASVGVSVHPTDGHDPHAILRNANSAMYLAMERGGDRHVYFSPEMKTNAQRRTAIESRLHLALASDEFHVEYQPLLDVQTHRLVGAEALLRWNNADLGAVAPRRFIPVAEEAGLIANIGRWVLETAGLRDRVWEDSGARLTVNVSECQVTDPEFLKSVHKLLEAGLPAERLELDLTESTLIRTAPETRDAIQELHDLGVRLALDDFGTGYSSLTHLRRFPLDSVKLDPMLLRTVTTSPEDAVQAAGVIAVAHQLGLTVIGEGVETEEQFEFLRQHGCDEAQGFYLAKPMPADEFRVFREKHA